MVTRALLLTRVCTGSALPAGSGSDFSVPRALYDCLLGSTSASVASGRLSRAPPIMLNASNVASKGVPGNNVYRATKFCPYMDDDTFP